MTLVDEEMWRPGGVAVPEAWHADPGGPAVVLLTRPRDADELLRPLGG